MATITRPRDASPDERTLTDMPRVDPWDTGRKKRRGGGGGDDDGGGTGSGKGSGRETKAAKTPLTPREVVRRQRRRRRRILIGMAIFTIIVDLAVGCGTAYFRWRIGQIKRVDLPSLAPEAKKGQPTNILLVGSDSRAGLTGEDAAQAGDTNTVGGQRSDTIMVLHLDPATQRGALLSIPRDLYLPIAGTGKSDRVNSAFSVGGADGLIETIQQSLKITINHYAEVDFVGFKGIIDAVGGVKVYVAAPARDFHSGLNLPQAGCVTLDGRTGLAYVRSRYYEQLQNGRWVSDTSSDLGRIERQQNLLRTMAREAASTGVSNPLALNRLIGIGVNNLTLDSQFSTSDITDLAKKLKNLNPDEVEMMTLPTSYADIGGASVLLLKEAEAKPLIDRINGVAPVEPAAPPTSLPAGPAPAQVRVKVYNGIGVPGAASRAATALSEAGFPIVERGDADNAAYTRTVIRYAAGNKAAGEAVQQRLTAGGDLVEDKLLTGADVAVVIGKDYTGVKSNTGTAAGGTATTVAGAGAGATTATTVAGAGASSATTATVPTTVAPAVTTTTVRPAC